MSGQTILVGDGEVARAAGDVAATRQALTGRISELHHRLEDVGGQWQGRGQIAFEGAIEAWRRTAERVIGALDDLHEQLTGAQATYDDTESVVEQRLDRYAAGLG